MYHFHEAVSHLQLLEDDVVETFTSWHEQGLREQELIDMTRRVDYDQDGEPINYCRTLTIIFISPVVYTILFIIFHCDMHVLVWFS